jgi:hypothetical protein
MANNPTTGAKYPYAVPFDFIRDFKALQQQVKDMQISTSGPAGPWNNVTTLQSSWTFQTGGNFQWRTTGNLGVQINCYRIKPGTLTDGTIVVSGLPASLSQKEFPVAVDKQSATSARFVYSTGGALICDGLLAATTDVSFIVTVPLDI